MKIYFEQKGGLAGVSRSVSIDTNVLPSSEAQEVHSMVENSKFFELLSKSSPPDRRAADYFKYTITLQTEDGRKHTVETTDLTKGSELGPLIAYLRRKITEQNKR
jgi:hypothetical protein